MTTSFAVRIVIHSLELVLTKLFQPLFTGSYTGMSVVLSSFLAKEIVMFIFSWLLSFQAPIMVSVCTVGGTAAAVPPPFRPSDPALCGSCPLVTPYYCRLGDLLC